MHILGRHCMASNNLSDMLSKRVFQSALKAKPHTAVFTSAGRPPIAIDHLVKLSTFDRPAAPTLEENAYYDKYKDKLEKVKYTKPKEYEELVKQLYGGKKDTADEIVGKKSDAKGASILEQMQSTSTAAKESKPSSDESKVERRGLESIMKLELLNDKTAAEITQLWNNYFSVKEGFVYATIPIEKYNRLKVKGAECPLFIYALPRDAGYEFMVGQCSRDDWYYTPLISYQTHGEYAPYSLAIQHFTELADSKGIVLMKGEIASQDLPPQLATLLIHQTQLVYGSDENFKMVDTLNKKPNEFKHMEVVDMCKKAGLF